MMIECGTLALWTDGESLSSRRGRRERDRWVELESKGVWIALQVSRAIRESGFVSESITTRHTYHEVNAQESKMVSSRI